MIAHHPPEEHLLSYAAGSLAQGPALVVAAHLNYCPACRAGLREAESVGGAMLEAEAVAAMESRLDHLVLDGAGEAPRKAPPEAGVDVPSPLRPYVGKRFADARWRTFWPGMQIMRIPLAGDETEALLLRLKPGTGMPLHTHAGEEMTICLQGGYSNETGHFAVGDVEAANAELTHRPLADPGPLCVCLTVFDAPLKFVSPWARLAARWVLR